jgi:hypothetical protein
VLAADLIATHGYRWIDCSMSPRRSSANTSPAIEVQFRGAGPWAGISRCSPHTRARRQEGGFHNADSHADDLPYWDTSCGKPQLIVPYAFDRTICAATPQGFNSGDSSSPADSFDVCTARGDPAAHDVGGAALPLAGRPGRTAALRTLS